MNSDESWSHYWLQGCETSFGNTLTDGYIGSIKTAWEEFFSTIVDYEHVLDICTGNATLIRMAKRSLVNFDHIYFTGVDYAKIKIDENLKEMLNVKLLFGINIEALPFRKNMLDHVMSNFGLEYSNLKLSIAEISRTLKIKGRVQLICHHEDSILIKNSRVELDFLNDLFIEHGALLSLENLLIALTTNEDENVKESYRYQLNESLSVLEKKYRNVFYTSDFMSFFKFIFNPKVKDKLKDLLAYKKETLAYKIRVSLMVNSALTIEKIEKLKYHFNENSLVISKEKYLSEESETIAYLIEAQKV